LIALLQQNTESFIASPMPINQVAIRNLACQHGYSALCGDASDGYEKQGKRRQSLLAVDHMVPDVQLNQLWHEDQKTHEVLALGIGRPEFRQVLSQFFPLGLFPTVEALKNRHYVLVRRHENSRQDVAVRFHLSVISGSLMFPGYSSRLLQHGRAALLAERACASEGGKRSASSSASRVFALWPRSFPT
jgi:hypothetical protein